jgi:hypothetical protein
LERKVGLAGKTCASEGWKEAFVDAPAFKGDKSSIENQAKLAEQTAKSIQGYLSNNSVNPELLSGENGVNLFRYVLMGEMRGKDNRVFQLGNSILNSLGLNRYEKVRTDESMPSTTLGNAAESTTPADNTRVVTR